MGPKGVDDQGISCIFRFRVSLFCVWSNLGVKVTSHLYSVILGHVRHFECTLNLLFSFMIICRSCGDPGLYEIH